MGSRKRRRKLKRKRLGRKKRRRREFLKENNAKARSPILKAMGKAPEHKEG